jgi:hypothetical protein
MKYLLLLVVVLLAAAGGYRFFFAEENKPSTELQQDIDKEKYLFMVGREEDEQAWKRATLFFKSRGHLLGSDETTYSDTLIVNEYNQHGRGMYLAVRRKVVMDTVIYKVTAGYNSSDNPDFEREVALYIRTGKNRFRLE